MTGRPVSIRRAARVALAVGLVVADLVWAVAGSASATGTVVGYWPMDESSGPVMYDRSAPNLDGLNGVIGAAVVPEGADCSSPWSSGCYLFPGWTGNVDATGQLQGQVSAKAGAVAVPDPDGLLDPRTDSFSVSLNLQVTLVTATNRLPTASGASYNIVQKARANDPGGYWKLELIGSGAPLGKLRWVLSDGSHKAVVKSKQRVDDGAWHTVVAKRQANQLVLTVDGGVPATASALTVGDVHPSGKYAAQMTLGKKPGSTDPKDAFAGSLQQLVYDH